MIQTHIHEIPPHAPGSLHFVIPDLPRPCRIILFTAMIGDGGPDMHGRYEIVQGANQQADRILALVGDYDARANPPNIHYMTGGDPGSFQNQRWDALAGGIQYPQALSPDFWIMPGDTIWFEVLSGNLVISRLILRVEV